HSFRTSKPAIFGVRVLGGRIRTGESLMRQDGRSLGRIKAIRSGDKSLDGAGQGQEVAISVDGITIGRQIQPGDVLYVDLHECDEVEELERRVKMWKERGSEGSTSTTSAPRSP